MKTIGLLGGMSWESTLTYYQEINQGIQQALGGLHSAKIVMYSLDFEEIKQLQQQADWAEMTTILSQAAQAIQSAGANCLLICTNTMHKIAPAIQSSIQIPLLHIADATASVVIAQGIKTVGLLGTAFTMEQAFYKDKLHSDYGIQVITPNKQDRQIVHNIIYQELCLGQVKPESKQEYLRIINALVADGAEAVILGCTEIGMLVKPTDTQVELLDTTKIHAEQAIQFALSG